MKKTLWIIAAAFVLAACNKEAVKPEEPVVEDPAPVEYNFNFTVNHPSETKGIKTGWQRGDKVFFFFPGQTGGYVDMYCNGEGWGWTTTVRGNVSINMQGGTVSALYILPTDEVNGYSTFAEHNSESGTWEIKGANTDVFYLSAENVAYTVNVATYVPEAHEVVAEVAATIDLQAPERMIQFYIPSDSGANSISAEESFIFACRQAYAFDSVGMKTDGTINRETATSNNYFYAKAHKAVLGNEAGYYAWQILVEDPGNEYEFAMTKNGIPYLYKTTLASPLTPGKAVKLSSLVNHPFPMFTVNGSNKKVIFSKANLRAVYNGTEWAWSIGDLGEKQYDYVGNAGANGHLTNTAPWISENSGTIDLFGWSTNASFFGINSSTDNSDYSGDFVDWGTIPNLTLPWYFSINLSQTWRTPTRDEWEWVLEYRSASTVNGTENARYAKARVASVNGLILFPDTYLHPSGVTLPEQINVNDEASDEYSAEEWEKMEKAGCIFLPASGARMGTSVFDPGVAGYYWASSVDESSSLPEYMILYPVGSGHGDRYYAKPVRLIMDIL